MGGAVGVMRASTDPRIKYLVSLAGMVHTAKFAAVEFGDATPDAGFMWDEEDCPLSQKYVDDMNQIDSVVELGTQVRVPWLLVHGSEDDVVPIEESHDIIAKANQPNELFVIEGSNHVFSEHTEVMVEKVVAWVREQFGT
jgi:dipeptidyl aminopeptidase/acylaminoacyl peptidase